VRRAVRADTAAVGQLIPFPSPRGASYETAALDRLVAAIDRRRQLRAVGGDAAPRRPRRAAGTVIPFRPADR
jgi:hypothetical protein